MKHINAFLLKFFIAATALEIVFMLMTSIPFVNIILMTLTLNLVSYAVVDLFILYVSNNTIATAADFVLSVIVLLLFNVIFVTTEITFASALVASAVLAMGELLFHKFVARFVFA